MTLTPYYQYIGRSDPLPSKSGAYRFYLLLYGAASPLVESGAHHVSVKLRLACDTANSFYGYATSGAASAGGVAAFSWSWENLPASPWSGEPLTEGGVTYPTWTELKEGFAIVSTGYGAEKTIQLSGSFTFCDGAATWLPQLSTPVSVTAPAVLPMIAAASQPSTSAASAAMGTALTVYTGRSSTELKHTLRYSFGAASGIIAEDVGDSCLWTPPISLASQIPNDPSAVATIICETYAGGTLIGSLQTYVTLTVPSDMVPTAAISWSDLSGAWDTVDSLVQNVSRLECAVTGTGTYGSTIVSKSVLLQGKGYTGGLLTESGELTLTAVVTDSRGRRGTKEETITVAPYAAPSLHLSASRCTEDGTADDGGGCARITVTGFVTDVGSGNRSVLTVYWGSEYENVSGGSGEIAYSKIVEADPDTTMAISATLSDMLITTPRSMTLSTGYATLDLLSGGKGIALGKAATREGFDCAMPAYFTGGVEGITAADVGAAPSGFGLGTAGVYNSAVDSIFNGGFYRWDTDNDQTPFANGTLLVVPRAKNTSATQLAFSNASTTKGVMAFRTTTASAVGSWAFINPLMKAGTQYLTTEFRKGKPVYKKLISFGTLPASGEKHVDTGLAFADYEIVGYSLQLLHSSGSYVYFLTPYLTFGFYESGDNWYATAEVGSDLSAYTVTVVIHYVEKG